MDYICLKESTHCEFYDSGKCHNVENCAYAIAGKPSAFNYADYKKLVAENISLRAERDALAKSISIVSEPIETIQPRGIVE